MRIADTTSGDQLIQDEEILAVLADIGDQYFAAARCARQISGRFARRSDKTVGRLRIAGQASQHYESLACQLEMEAAMRSQVYAGGISISDKSNVVSDSDRVIPAFRIGMDDLPGTNQIGTTS